MRIIALSLELSLPYFRVRIDLRSRRRNHSMYRISSIFHRCNLGIITHIYPSAVRENTLRSGCVSENERRYYHGYLCGESGELQTEYLISSRLLNHNELIVCSKLICLPSAHERRHIFAWLLIPSYSRISRLGLLLYIWGCLQPWPHQDSGRTSIDRHLSNETPSHKVFRPYILPTVVRNCRGSIWVSSVVGSSSFLG